MIKSVISTKFKIFQKVKIAELLEANISYEQKRIYIEL